MIGSILRSLREENGYTQKQIAAYLGITPGAVSNYEKDKREPSYSTLKALSKLYCVPVDYLLGRTEEKFDITRFDEECAYGVSYSRILNSLLSGERTEERLRHIARQIIMMSKASGHAEKEAGKPLPPAEKQS